MFLRNNRVINLNYRAYLLSGYQNSTLFAPSGKGIISLVNLEACSLNSITLATKDRGTAFSNSNKLIAFIEENTGKLNIADFSGQSLFCEEPPMSVRNNVYSEFEGFLACYFDDYAKRLWCAVRLSEDDVELQLRRLYDWGIICKIIIKDYFGYSSFSFYATPHTDTLALWVAAGQDGQKVYWVKNQNDVITYQDSELSNTTPPFFSPSGSEFLVQFQYESFHQYQYSNSQKIGEYALELTDEDDIVGDSVCYLSEDLGLISSQNGRIFLIDTKGKTIIEEVIIENHELKPISDYYPNLKDTNLCTDISWFQRIGDTVVFIYRYDREDFENWKDSLIVIPVAKILDHFKV